MDADVFVPCNLTITVGGIKICTHTHTHHHCWCSIPHTWMAHEALQWAWGSAERHFDHCLSCSRNIVECAFGHLKACWRCLQSSLNIVTENVTAVVAAWFILHNICIILQLHGLWGCEAQDQSEASCVRNTISPGAQQIFYVAWGCT